VHRSSVARTTIVADMDPVLKAIADPWLIYYRIDRSPSSIAQWLVAIIQDEVLNPVFGFAIARTTRYIGISDSAKSLSLKSCPRARSSVSLVPPTDGALPAPFVLAEVHQAETSSRVARGIPCRRAGTACTNTTSTSREQAHTHTTQCREVKYPLWQTHTTQCRLLPPLTLLIVQLLL
jgi:hypothetical protein